MPLVEFRDVVYEISGKTILSEINFSVEIGETLVLLGRSGSGKSTALKLTNGMLFPTRGDRPNPATVTVTPPAGATVTGRLVYRDEFTVALTDSAGWYRSFPIDRVKVTVDDPLDTHRAQLGKYTDQDMHDVLAYLQTLR